MFELLRQDELEDDDQDWGEFNQLLDEVLRTQNHLLFYQAGCLSKKTLFQAIIEAANKGRNDPSYYAIDKLLSHSNFKDIAVEYDGKKNNLP